MVLRIKHSLTKKCAFYLANKGLGVVVDLFGKEAKNPPAVPYQCAITGAITLEVA
jgi:hypothetical protein